MTNRVAINYEYKMMNDRDERLSSLLDDYRDTDEDRSVLDELQADVNQQYTLRRYQVIGNVMRNELSDAIDLDFEARVKSQIEREDALQVSRTTGVVQQKRSSWLWSTLFKPVAGLAVVATVAVVTVSSLQLQQPAENESSSVAANDASKAKVEQLANIPVVSNVVRVSGNSQRAATPTGTIWKIKRGKPDMQNKLNTYLINHNEYSNSMQGIIPQARVVGFDGER